MCLEDLLIAQLASDWYPLVPEHDSTPALSTGLAAPFEFRIDDVQLTVHYARREVVDADVFSSELVTRLMQQLSQIPCISGVRLLIPAFVAVESNWQRIQSTVSAHFLGHIRGNWARVVGSVDALGGPAVCC